MLGDDVSGQLRTRQREGSGVRPRVVAIAALYGVIVLLLIEGGGPIRILTILERHWAKQ